MARKDVLQILLELIGSEICGKQIDKGIAQELTQQTLEQLYSLAVSHDMVHIAASALQKLGAIGEDEISQKFSRQQMIAIFRCERIGYELDLMTQTLEQAEISFIPLKGAVIRSFYPEAWMRTSCDVDVLVHESDLDRAQTVLSEKLGYVAKGKNSHDIPMDSPGGVHVELHYDLLEDGVANKSSRILADMWSYASVKQGAKYHYVITDEMFYFYHIAHMAKHMEHGGCGIKPFLDMYLLDRHLECDEDKLQKLLKDGDLAVFNVAARQLYEAWFCDREHTALTVAMQNYVVSGGVYGTLTNKVSAQQTRRGGRLGYMLSKVFPSYVVMKSYYPILKKHKLLLPAMHVRRWCRLLFCGGVERSVNELKINNDVDTQRAEELQRLFDAIGL